MPKTATKNNTSIKNLKPYFSWFDNVFSSDIKENIAEFFGFSASVKLFSLEKNSKNFFVGNNYFVTQAQTNRVTYCARLSETACDMFLTKSLGTNNDKYFSLNNLTELEASIISKFNNNLFRHFDELFISKKEINKLLDNDITFDDNLNLGFVIKSDEGDFEIGKLFFTIPEKLIKLPELPETQQVIDTTKFTKALTPVDIFVGKTRLSLEDINHLENEDIVVLEYSDIKKMAITNPTSIDFNVNPDPRLFINDDKDDDTNMEDIGVSNKDIWDNVQVDVCAKFPKVKMSLGELREMAEGVVMELDSVYGNEVVLEVENKSVAKGELVIVGYKYGVKITEIFSQDAIPNEIPMEQNVPTIEENNDDFDVQDFEIKE